MATKHSRVTVATTPTLIDTYDVQTVNGCCVIQNLGTASVYLGDSSVSTSSYGYELKANSSLSLDLITPDALYGVVASGTVTVNTLLLGV